MNTEFRLLIDDQGSSAVEFALTLPLSLVLIFLAIDGGRYLYNSNRIEKATQFGARFAVVTDPVASDLTTTDYVGQVVNGVPLTQGDRIPAAALTSFTCNSTTCGVGHTFNATSFNNIVSRMKLIAPEIKASNVTVAYSGSGLGYAGDPSGMQISPLVTVKVSNLKWQPITGFLLVHASYPAIGTTLSVEDSIGSQSY